MDPELTSAIKGFEKGKLRETTTHVTHDITIVSAADAEAAEESKGAESKSADAAPASGARGGVVEGIKNFFRGSPRPTETKEPTPVPVMDAALAEERRAVLEARAVAAPTVSIADDADCPEEVHGFKFIDAGWEPAGRAVECEAEARPGYATRKAHEYVETEATLAAKAKELAKMIRAARNCVAYTGAGISTASGIGDYASRTRESLGAGKTRPKLRSPFEARPTLSHHVLAQMHKAGQLQYWIQQNHDGLPQKAGFPQHMINEIHGAWFDPSNPVVPMSGELRGDLFRDLLTWEERADLVLAMGSSLCGMNADRVATTCASKAMAGEDGALGAVIVALQRTQYDSMASLRIYATIDDVMALVAKELGDDAAVAKAQSAGTYSLPKALKAVAAAAGGAGGKSEELDDERAIFRVPYDRKTGKRVRAGEAGMVLDLSDGATVRLTAGMYKGDEGVVLGRQSDGHWRLQLKHCMNPKRSDKKVPFVRVLGSWWAEAAVTGSVPLLPIVNVRARPASDVGGGAGPAATATDASA
mmetsp:Transcript_111925/g.311083  ORF Transcript_111925/g.311083 Transcript_111925/m.311083 type:complete len:531 (-) Transcript_111925:99-1691(-)